MSKRGSGGPSEWYYLRAINLQCKLTEEINQANNITNDWSVGPSSIWSELLIRV